MDLKKVFVLCLVISWIANCQGNQSGENDMHSGPKTSYGQSVKKAKDLSKDLSNRDRKVQEQTDNSMED